MIPMTELARRICTARHPLLAQTLATVPCGEDIRTATLSYGLLSEQGTAAFVTIANARIEAGLPVVEQPDPYEPTFVTPTTEAGA